jgi:tetraacyldisaccharide 4'-kinase
MPMDTAAAGIQISPGQPPPADSPWQRLYAAAHRLRRRWYRERARRLPLPVISVGNLHWGGSGKTPLVAAVAAHLRQRGLAVCILSRGYGRRGGGVRIVSRGDGPLLAPAEAGDEPVQLAGELPGVAIVVGADRHRAGLEALARLRPAPDLFLLDDGFSHLALHRDLDLLAFPAADPFGGGRLWPGGRLREPLAAAARADAALLTGAAAVGGSGAAGPGATLAAALRPYGFTGPGFACALRAGAAVLHGPAGIVPLAAGSRVLLVSAIARPERFAATVRELDFAVMDELRFPDHHAFPEASLARIAARAAASGAAAVLVTAKDRVKLLGRLEAPLAELPVAAEPEPAFWTWLDAAADRLLAGSGAGPHPPGAGGGPRR